MYNTIKNKFLYLIAGIGLVATSCSKSFLDEVKPADGTLSPLVIFGSKAGVDNALTGTYGLLRNYISSNGAQNMRGIKSWQLNFDVRGNDLFSDPGNWWLYETNWSDNTYGRIATSARNRTTWEMFYQVINNANNVIKYTNQIPESQAVKDNFVAEAKALRGFAYFNLLRTYQFTYANNTSAPGVPIYTSPTSDTTAGNPKSSIKDVYALITSDLESAVSTLTATRTAKFRINKNVAAGILAEVYQELAMADNTLWAKASANADTALKGYPLMSAADYKSGFNSVGNGEWLWGLVFNATQSPLFASFFGYIEPTNSPNPAFKARYNDIYVNSSFVSLFTATDMRNTFLAATGQSAANPWKKWVTIKFQDNATQSGDFVMMRSAEMYLIKAEAQAQLGNLSDAKQTLYTLQVQRDPAAVKSTTTAKDDIINEILLERRKELFGEIGVGYFDLKRYQRPLVRDGNHWSLLNIPATSNQWRWQIPQTEMDANKALTSADQNPL